MTRSALVGFSLRRPNSLQSYRSPGIGAVNLFIRSAEMCGIPSCDFMSQVLGAQEISHKPRPQIISQFTAQAHLSFPPPPPKYEAGREDVSLIQAEKPECY